MADEWEWQVSIWCSWEQIGTESGDWYEVNEDDSRGAKVIHQAERGDVLAYPAGFSNAYPGDEEIYGPVATVGVNHIPVWCVPGHREEVDDVIAPWLRLDVDSPNALTWWRKDDDDNPTPEPVHASVVLDEEAVRSLRDDLTEWLERPKAYPSEEQA